MIQFIRMFCSWNIRMGGTTEENPKMNSDKPLRTLWNLKAKDSPHSHTPGPWEYGPANNYDGYYIAPQGTLPTLASVERCGLQLNVQAHNFPGHTEANARLIAAAPELLALVKQYASECNYCHGTGVEVIPDSDGWFCPDPLKLRPCNECMAIREVIAKAEGLNNG